MRAQIKVFFSIIGLFILNHMYTWKVCISEHAAESSRHCKKGALMLCAFLTLNNAKHSAVIFLLASGINYFNYSPTPHWKCWCLRWGGLKPMLPKSRLQCQMSVSSSQTLVSTEKWTAQRTGGGANTVSITGPWETQSSSNSSFSLPDTL